MDPSAEDRFRAKCFGGASTPGDMRDMRRILRAGAIALLFGPLLWSCASTPPVDLKAAVRVLNVYRTGQEALPRQVAGCEFLGTASASVPEAQANSITTGFYDPTPLLETIRSRAHRKGADTAFVSIAPPVRPDGRAPYPPGADRLQLDERSLRATIFHCGESQSPMALGVPVHD